MKDIYLLIPLIFFSVISHSQENQPSEKPVVAPTAPTVPAIPTGPISPQTPDYFYQPSQGQHVFEAMLAYTPQYSMSLGTPGGTKVADIKSGGTVETMTFGYGVSNTLAFGIGTSYKTDKTDITYVPALSMPDETYKSKGFGDVTIGVLGASPRTGYSFHYGLTASVSPGKAHDTTPSKVGNEYSGGYDVDSFAGISTKTENGFIGAKVGYKLQGDRTKGNNFDPEQDDKFSGGSEFGLAGFYEYHRDDWIFDAEIGLVTVDSVKSTFANGNKSTADSYQRQGAAIGWQIQLNKSTNIKIGYELVNYASHSINSQLDQSTVNARLISGRFRFEY